LIYGVSSPLEDKWVLVSDEIAAVRNATTGFNQAIVNLANSKGLPDI